MDIMTTMGILANNKGFLPTCVTARWPRHSPFPRGNIVGHGDDVNEDLVFDGARCV